MLQAHKVRDSLEPGVERGGAHRHPRSAEETSIWYVRPDLIRLLEPEVQSYSNPHILEGLTFCPDRVVVYLQGADIQFPG